MITLARIVSVLSHPVFTTTWSFALCMLIYPEGLSPIPASNHYGFVILLFLTTALLPLVMIAILRTLRVIESVHIPSRKERILPFTLMTVLYLSITYLFYYQSKIHPSENFMKLMIIIDCLVIVSTVITLFFRISIHSVAVWGVIGILIYLNRHTMQESLIYPTIGIVAFAGIVMWARLVLQAHSLREVMWGAAAGLCTGLLGMQLIY